MAGDDGAVLAKYTSSLASIGWQDSLYCGANGVVPIPCCYCSMLHYHLPRNSGLIVAGIKQVPVSMH